MPVSFRKYIERTRILDTPAGDFIADAKFDKSLLDAKTWDELEAYLLNEWGRDPIDAARAAWGNYEEAHRRSRNMR
jgi:hypothetical protein